MKASLQDAKILVNSVEHLAERGFHAALIAAQTGLSKSAVYYRLHALGLSLRDYRNGKTRYAQDYILMTPCVKVEVMALKGRAYPVRPFVAPKKGGRGR